MHNTVLRPHGARKIAQTSLRRNLSVEEEVVVGIEAICPTEELLSLPVYFCCLLVKRKANKRSGLIFLPLSDKAYSLYLGHNVPSTLSSLGMVAYANRKVQENQVGL
jgi:hypothetical protein